MHELLKKYIENKEIQKREKLEKEKKQFLLDRNLVEKNYSPDNKYSDDYPYYDYDEELKDYRYYNESEISITDEEYELLRSYEDEEKCNGNNAIAFALKVIACIIFVCGFIGGFVWGTQEISLGSHYSKTEFSFTIALTCWLTSFVSGIFVLGFAEVISLLQRILQKIDKKQNDNK